MKLTGTIVKVASGRNEADKLERVTIRVNESTSSMFNEFVVPNVDELKLDDEVDLNVQLGVREVPQ